LRRGATGTPAPSRRAIARRVRPPCAMGIEAKSCSEFRAEVLILDPGRDNCRSWQQRTNVWHRVTSPEQTATTKKRRSLPAARRVRRPSYPMANAAGYLHDRAGMRVKFEAIDATGKVHKRSSTRHVYSHCVVIHFAAHPPSKLWPKGIA